MAQFKGRTTNINRVWNDKLRLKPNEVVQYLNSYYQNVTGINTTPGYSNWVRVGVEIVEIAPYIQNYTYGGGVQVVTIPDTAKILSVTLNEGRLLKETIDYTISGVDLTILYTLEVNDTIYITGLN